MNVSETGLIPIPAAGVTTPASIDAAYTLVRPTTAQRANFSGTLYCFVTIEGDAKAARYTVNGVTVTTTVGHLLPTSTLLIPQTLVLRGEDLITAFRIIGTAAGATVTYWFATADAR